MTSANRGNPQNQSHGLDGFSSQKQGFKESLPKEPHPRPLRRLHFRIILVTEIEFRHSCAFNFYHAVIQ